MKYSDYRTKLKHNAEFQEATEQLKYQFAFGDAVLERRLKNGWSQTELARRTGTKQANISRIESGMGNPTLDLIKKICDTLDLELIFQPKGGEVVRSLEFPASSIHYATEMPRMNVRGIREVSRPDNANEPGKPEKLK